MPECNEQPEFRVERDPANLDLHSVSELLHSVGMRSRDPDEMAKAISASTEVVAVHLRSGMLIGFGRLISDGVFYGSLWDVAVHPAYQRLGIGTVIIDALLQTSRNLGLYMVGLFTSPVNWRFYENRGFVVLDDVRAMKLQLCSESKHTA